MRTVTGYQSKENHSINGKVENLTVTLLLPPEGNNPNDS